MTRCHGSCATLLITVTALTHGLSRLGFLRLASRLTNLFNARVTTHVYPRRALWPSSQYHYPSCILPFPRRPHRPTRCGYGSALWFLSFFDFMHGVQARRYHSGTHSASSCTIRILSLAIVAVCLSRCYHQYPWSQIVMSTDQPRWLDYLVCSITLLLADLRCFKHHFFLYRTICLPCCRLVHL